MGIFQTKSRKSRNVRPISHTPSPISSNKVSFFFLQISKTSSNHIMYALPFLFYKPLNKNSLQKRLSVTPRSFMCYETSAIVSYLTSLPLKTFSQYTSQDIKSMAVLLTGGKLHCNPIYRLSEFTYLFIFLSSERIYHAAKPEKWRYDLSQTLSRVPLFYNVTLKF